MSDVTLPGDTEARYVDITTADAIQRGVADYLAERNVILRFFMEVDTYLICAEYSQSFFDHCILTWEEEGYNSQQVRETVYAALAKCAKLIKIKEANHRY